jgi:hypothetical protein
VADVKTDDRRENAGKWREVVPKLDGDGKLHQEGGGEAKGIDHVYGIFHVSLRYNPPGDLDIPVPSTAPAAAAAPAAKTGTKAAPKRAK